MNEIRTEPISNLGYGFIPANKLPKGKDEYHLRNLQNRSGTTYRQLNAYEMEVLVRNNNTSDDWSKVVVADSFNPELVKNCQFYGLVRIGRLEPVFLEFHGVRLAVGLYNSTIISSDIGDNVVINNVNYLSHYIICNQVIIVNVNELAATEHAKFGNGIIKNGEPENLRIWLEICNENGGRSVIPFNDMLPADAYIWSRYRNDRKLMDKFREFTQEKGDPQLGYYGKIGDRTIIKNTGIIKDVWIGTDAYIKGANKLKNLTINSSANAKSQIGEGCELVNGIIGEGCRVFYGVKAVRFILASHSQLKYGARLINSYLGNNATISCCEVLNSLIFPAHEQHHNNSFLCAALIMGQSNIAAGATIGSNHNSRSADGELIAGRGFWPGLCVSLKHNSVFASFTLLGKADYPHELNIPIPFSLVQNDAAKNRLVIMPAYWFLYNMYALVRNAGKYRDRDQRREKKLLIEYDYLAPDSVNEIFTAMEMMQMAAAKAYSLKQEKKIADKDLLRKGRELLENRPELLEDLEIFVDGFENSRRKVQLVKVGQAHRIFRDMIVYYGVSALLDYAIQTPGSTVAKLINGLRSRGGRTEWCNAGGQLITKPAIDNLISAIHKGSIRNWEQVHGFYEKQGEAYPKQKLQHAFSSMLEILRLTPAKFDKKIFRELIDQSIKTREWMVKQMYESRAKDYTNPFRTMVYETEKEMNEVLGSLEDNNFIAAQREELSQFKKKAKEVVKRFKL